jgi:hypothetical protein
VVVAGLKVAGNDAGDELCGCRSSGELGLIARRHGRVRKWCCGLLEMR